jgi:hypothetical protein
MRLPRITGRPGSYAQGRRWPEVGFEEIAIDLLQARCSTPERYSNIARYLGTNARLRRKPSL